MKQTNSRTVKLVGGLGDELINPLKNFQNP